MRRKDTGLQAGGAAMLVLALLKEEEMYGYQMVEELARRSQNVFQMKEGTLYPVLHGLERDGLVAAAEREAPNGRQRRYYRLTAAGLRALEDKRQEWETYSRAVTAVLAGGGA